MILRNASSRFTRLFLAAVRTALASSACSLPAKLPVLVLPVTFGFAADGASAPPDDTASEEGAAASPAADFFCCGFFSFGCSGAAKSLFL